MPAPKTLGDTPDDINTESKDSRNSPPDGYISRSDLDEILAERDAKHAAETARLRTANPQAVVAAHGGGPGNDHHQVSWSKAEQELAQRGEILDTWDMPE